MGGIASIFAQGAWDSYFKWLLEPVRVSASYPMRYTVTLPKTGETMDVHGYMQKPWDFQFFQRWSVLTELTKENELVCRLETVGGKGCFCTPAFAKKGWHWFGAQCKGEACLGKKRSCKIHFCAEASMLWMLSSLVPVWIPGCLCNDVQTSCPYSPD